MSSFKAPIFGSLLVLGVFVAHPASSAVASMAADKGELAAPKAPVDKRAAERLCAKVKATPQFKTLAKDKASDPLANEVCRFYAVQPAAKQKYWDQLLGELVKAGRLTAKDKGKLSKLLVEPAATLATWKPDTNFGRVVRDLLEGNGQDNAEPHASTAGDIGTIVGAMLGGLGGTPASVALGAALGKLAGEAANVLGHAAYNLAPDRDGGNDGGGDDGGDGGENE